MCERLIHYMKSCKRTVKILVILLYLSGMQVFGKTYSQKISISMQRGSLVSVLQSIKQQSGYMFLYNDEAVKGIDGISVHLKEVSLEHALEIVFKNQPFSYYFEGKTIVLVPRPGFPVKSQKEKPEVAIQRTLRAKVTNQAGEPIPAATVSVRGTSQSTKTDAEGVFVLMDVKDSDVIIFSSVGFQQVTLPVSQVGASVMMPEIVSVLDDVVVTGYQTINRKLFTGAATQVKMDDIKMEGVVDVSRMLEGRVAGVSVQNVSGTFGTAPKIRVRGATSISGENKPLWVVDGVVLEDVVNVSNDQLSSGDPLTLLGSSVAGINANDIESFEVLKDASATALYGARAMNGVVVITTKKGKSGKARVMYNGNFSSYLKPSYRTYDIMNSADQMSVYLELERKGWLNHSTTSTAKDGGVFAKMYDLINIYDETSGQFGLRNTPEAQNAFLTRYANANTDWFDLLFNNSFVQEHAVSISSGTENAQHYFSTSYYNDSGWTIADRAQRYTANIRSNYNLSDKVKLGTIVSASVRNQDAPGSNTRVDDAVRGEYTRDFDINPFSYALNTSRTLTAYDENGNLEYFRRSYAPFNILNELENNSLNVRVMDLKLQGDVGYKFLEDFEFNVLGSMRYVKTGRDQRVTEYSNMAQAYRANWSSSVVSNNPYLYTDPDFPIAEPMVVLPQGGLLHITDDEMVNFYMRNTLKWNREFDAKHTVSAFIGQEIKYATRRRNYNRGYGYQFDSGGVPFTDYRIIKQLLESSDNYFGLNEWYDRYAAFFVNANYAYDRRYVANLTFRYDGSNQMGMSTTARWLPTWTLSTAWNIDEEKFMENVHAIDFLKLRGTYGLTASMGSATNSSAIFRDGSTFRPNLSELESSIQLVSLENSELTWEKQYEANVGIDIGLYRGKLNFSADYYNRNGFDLIGSYRTSGIGGQAFKQANYADMKSHGVELTLGGKILNKSDFKYSANLTFGYNKNKITNLKNTPVIYSMVVPTGGVKEGGAVRGLYSIPFVGLDPFTGIPSYITETGRPGVNVNMQSSTTDILIYEGSVDPLVTGGFSNTFNYKQFSLNVFFSYQTGNKIRLNPFYRSMYSDISAMPNEFFDRRVLIGDEQFTNIPSILEFREYTELGAAWPYNTYNYSNYRVVDGSFIRLKTVSLGYTMDERLVKALGVNSLSFNLHGTNLFLLYSDKRLRGQDPEFFNAGGVALPMPQQFTLSLKLGF